MAQVSASIDEGSVNETFVRTNKVWPATGVLSVQANRSFGGERATLAITFA
jgi:hypothetical protein